MAVDQLTIDVRVRQTLLSRAIRHCVPVLKFCPKFIQRLAMRLIIAGIKVEVR